MFEPLAKTPRVKDVPWAMDAPGVAWTIAGFWQTVTRADSLSVNPAFAKLPGCPQEPVMRTQYRVSEAGWTLMVAVVPPATAAFWSPFSPKYHWYAVAGEASTL